MKYSNLVVITILFLGVAFSSLFSSSSLAVNSSNGVKNNSNCELNRNSICGPKGDLNQANSGNSNASTANTSGNASTRMSTNGSAHANDAINSANNSEQAVDLSNRQEKKYVGVLSVNAVAIGGETTGYTLTTEQGTLELLLTREQKNKIRSLDKQKITVIGIPITLQGIERGPRPAIKVISFSLINS